ncbi:outer membrane beta-barrel protein [Sphingobacterium endophyticum]|uniref:outer membrane beta-barrel protein n=1 Tax=Sphingobacterium endophyticum TaxID=2546448 RepID=UPI0012E11DF2|nr:outer membrane beta-barrel protein [Sphingobacterium endophyticum]
MKRIISGIFLTVATVTVSHAQSNFGMRGGLNLSSEYMRLDNQSATTKLAPMYHLTVYYDVLVSPGFSVQPGLSLEAKGGKSEIGGESLTDRLLYLQVPVNFLGRARTRSGDFFFGGGPFLAYGIDARVTSGRNAIHLEWGSGPEQLRPFDFGLGVLLGYRMDNGLVFHMGSNAGFINMSNQDGAKYLNRTTSVGIGYEFRLR